MADQKDRTGVLLRDTSTHAFTLLAIVLRDYGEAVFTEDALALYADIHDDYGAWLPQTLENRLQAILTAMTNDAYLEDPSVFESVIKAITSGDPDLEGGDTDITYDEMLWTDYQVRLARGETSLAYGPLITEFFTRLEQTEHAQSEDEYDLISGSLDTLKGELREQLVAAGFEFDYLPDIV